MREKRMPADWIAIVIALVSLAGVGINARVGYQRNKQDHESSNDKLSIELMEQMRKELDRLNTRVVTLENERAELRLRLERIDGERLTERLKYEREILTRDHRIEELERKVKALQSELDCMKGKA
jgi:predicted RNase H-like nuclease (RuvC/YqgF family)